MPELVNEIMNLRSEIKDLNNSIRALGGIMKEFNDNAKELMKFGRSDANSNRR